LQQVLVNLVLNGIQSAGDGGRVCVSARPADPSLDRERPDRPGGLEIEVRDDGPGIAAEHLDRIFNPFFTTRSEGTGLGLAIVHGIVEAHGGTIRAGNCGPTGARFVVRLPPPSD
jgi:signal transduction histidine kinase